LQSRSTETQPELNRVRDASALRFGVAMSEQNSAQVFIGTKQLLARYGGRSHMFVERLLKNDPTFPKPTFIGRLRFWKIADLEEWERQRAAKAPPEPAGAARKKESEAAA